MAKESMKAREVKRQRLVAKYAAKRKAWKLVIMKVSKVFQRMLLLSDYIIDVKLQDDLKDI